MRTQFAVFLTAALFAALPVSAAAAADLEVAGKTSITYTAASGVANAIGVVNHGTYVTITDTALAKRMTWHGTDGGHCTTTTLGYDCDVTADALVRIIAGDGDDTVTVTGAITARLEGGDGNDVLIGGDAADRLLGGAGDDRLVGGAGADRIEGGDGVDVADYGSSLLPVRVVPDGSAGDGTLGEGDDVEPDVEGSVGGAGNDELTAGRDGGTLEGGAGDDILHGGPGTDVFLGGDGNDTIFSADSAAEVVSCGDGSDTVTADAFDTVASNCEAGAAGAPAPDVKPSDRGRGTSTRASDDGDRNARALAPVGSDDAPNSLDVDQIAPVVEKGVPLPQLGRRVSVAPAAGVVMVTPPGEKTERLSDGASLPVGALVDTTRGAVTLTAANTSGGGLQTARFQGAKFRVTQTTGANPVTELRLTGPAPECAPKTGKAVAAAKRRPKVRRLWGSGHGRFRTRGKYAAATVRGTIWLTEDRCAGTYVAVRRGIVGVRDQVRKRTVTVTAGKHYLARAR